MVWWPVPHEHVPVLPPTKFSSLYAVGVLRSGSGRSAAGGVIHLPTVVRGRIQTDSTVRFVRFRSYITTRIRFPHVKLRKRRGSRAWRGLRWSCARGLPTSGRCRFCNDVSRRALDGCDSWPLARNRRSQPRCDPRSESEMVSVQAHIGLAGRRKNESAQTAKRASACPDARSAPTDLKMKWQMGFVHSLNYH